MLALVVVAAIALQGSPVFTGPRISLPWGTQQPDQGPRTQPAVTGTPEPRRPDSVIQVDLSWLVIALVVIALAVVAALVWRAIRRALYVPERDSLAALGAVGEPDASEPDVPEVAPVRRGLARALELLAEPREPRDAIEQAWLGLEEGAEDSGVRRLPAETPGEFVTRVVARVSADRAAARALLDVYLHARFGSAAVTDADVAIAREALETLRRSWTADAPARGTR